MVMSDKPFEEDVIFSTFGIFIVNFILKTGEALRDHFDEIKGCALIMVLSLKLIKETFERTSIALRRFY